MSEFRLSKKSLKKLEGVHTDLVRVVARAIDLTECDFSVHEGLRNIKRQKDLVARGKSKTMNSRHLIGEAVDLWIYPLDWKDKKRWKKVAKAMKRAAADLGVEITSGHLDWGWDSPHFQLEKK